MRHSYTFESKKKIAREAKKATIRSVATRYKIDRKCIRQWMKLDSKGAFDEEDSDRRRIGGAGRPLVCGELDDALIQTIKTYREEHRRVTRNKVIEIAASILESMSDKPELNLSNGWLDCFLNRHNLVKRKATNKPKLPPEVIVSRGVNFVRHFRELIETYDIERHNIVNFDETAIFSEHNKDCTLEERGATDVPIKSFGLEKVRLTAVFAARGDGTKLRPCVLDKGTSNTISTIAGVPVLTNQKSWMNSDSFIRYIDYMFPFTEPNKLLLVFDSARSHISKKSKAHLQARRILYVVIPGGLTAFLQPCDYGIFKPLKENLANLIDEWKVNGPHEYTRGGNVKPPSLTTVIGWMKSAWSDISEESIRRSFRSCFLGHDNELVLARHCEYGPMFVTKLCGNVNNVENILENLMIDEGSDMDLDEDDYEIDFNDNA